MLSAWHQSEVHLLPAIEVLLIADGIVALDARWPFAHDVHLFRG